MKKRIIGAICLALPLLVSTTVSDATAQTYDGKMTGYVETTHYQDGTSDGVYKLAFQVTNGADTSYVRIDANFDRIL